MEKTIRKDISLPPFVANRHSLIRDGGGQVDWSLVTDRYRQGSFSVVLTANAAANATSIAVAALKKAIVAGTTLDFGGVKFARVAAAAAAGATSITVVALGVALVTADTAWTGGWGYKYIPAGTAMDKLASGKLVPSALNTASVTCYSLIETGAHENSKTDSMTGYGQFIGGVFYENLLPDSLGGVFSPTFKTELRANGGSWQFLTYSDNT